MATHSYLTFSISNLRYGIDAAWVQEIFYLPEIRPVVDTPPDWVGIVDVRGRMLPIIDLDRRLHSGSQASTYHLTDSVIVLAYHERQVGIIVNAVHDVEHIPDQAVTASIENGSEWMARSQLVAGIVKVDAEIVTLLHLESLLSDVAETSTSDLVQQSHAQQSYIHQRFWPDATFQERQILQERAQNLGRSPDSQEQGLIPLAIVGLSQEYFGLDVELVREFTAIPKVTLIPCCPSHIIGNINLRGEIVTLIDIRAVLNLTQTPSDSPPQAMIVHLDDLVVGVLVDEVFDVMYLSPTEIAPLSTSAHSGGEEYLRGTASYQERLMGILDLGKILIQGGLEVDEVA